jgi:hypothetical protein
VVVCMEEVEGMKDEIAVGVWGMRSVGLYMSPVS